jgi:hypothetical protein
MAMRLTVGLSALAVALIAGCSSIPSDTPTAAAEHAAHHAAGGGSAAPAGYDLQMKSMQEMHQKMAAAKTPEERAALMKEHMQSMRKGMGMMGQMDGGMKGMDHGPATVLMDATPMARHKEMMETTMQMMTDCDGMKPQTPR